MTDEITLLPCPFCGDSHATTTYTRDGRLVVCTSCGAKSGNYYHGPKDLPSADERAIAAWNRRASQAAPAPSDALREAWIAGRDAAAAEAFYACGCKDSIEALTPPAQEVKP